MVECPYCVTEQEVNHDDGYGYEEDVLCQQSCVNCEKTFAFTTSISFYHEGLKADCLNGSPHKFKSTITHPKQFTMMECEDCEEKREPTPEEWKEINQ